MDKQDVLSLMVAILQAPDLARSTPQLAIRARQIYEAIEAKLAEAKEGKPVIPA